VRDVVFTRDSTVLRLRPGHATNARWRRLEIYEGNAAEVSALPPEPARDASAPDLSGTW
jgi:hypothetical protein